MWLGLALVDWLVVLGFLAGMVVVGTVLSRMVRTEDDFFMGGRRYGKVLMTFFSFASATSSEEAVSVTAGTWRAGLAGIWWAFLWLWATPVYWIVAPVLRRMRALTTSDFFAARFGRRTATLYAAYGLLILVATMAGELYGSGKLLDALTGGELDRVAQGLAIDVPLVSWDEATGLGLGWRRLEGHELAILALTVLFVAYGIAGGLAADILTDFIQGVLTLFFSFLLLPWLFARIGGVGALREHAAARPGMLDLFGHPEVAKLFGTEPLTVFYVVMLALVGVIGVVVQPQIMSMCGAGRTEFESRVGFTYGHLMKRFCTIAWAFIGLACIVWYLDPATSPLDQVTRERLTHDAGAGAAKAPFDPELDREFADGLFGRVARDLLPPGLIGLLLVGSLAATTSSADTRMLAAGALFTEGFYRPHLAPGRSSGHYLWAGRIASVAAVALAIVLQTTFTDVIDAVKFVIKTTAPVGISFWIGIAWRGWTPAAVWVSSLVAYAVWAACALFPGALAAAGLGGLTTEVDGRLRVADAWTILLYLSAGLLAGLVTSLCTRRPPREQLDRFFRLLRTPVRPGEVVAEPCTLPERPEPEVPRWFPRGDVELPRPSREGMTGLLVACGFVALIAALPSLITLLL
jgi:Na+/proline symporter